MHIKFHKTLKIIIIILIFVLLGGWAFLTRAGIIPNFLHLELLDDPITKSIRSCSGAPCKPVIYLYSTKPQDVEVQLEYNGTIIASYPKYNAQSKGWKVRAFPDGHLINLSDNKEYSYLFWEGENNNTINWNLTKGFVVRGEDTAIFLQQMLSRMGLTPKEYNEFIVYWYPQMKNNKYNLIHFAGEEYNNLAKLTITPKPDSILRVFMVYKPLESEITLEPQEIVPFMRNGFTVVEWGGTEIR